MHMKRAAFFIVCVIPVLLLWFAYTSRQGELFAVRTVSDFYMSFLAKDAGPVSITRSLTTASFLTALTNTVSHAATCGLPLPEQVRVGSASTFWNSGTVTVVFIAGSAQEVATVSLVRQGGAWLVNRVACENGGGVLPVDEHIKQSGIDVSIFVYDATRDLDAVGNAQCLEQSVIPVARTIQSSLETVVEDTVRVLLSQPISLDEKSRGLSSEFPLEGVRLVSITVEDGVARVNIEDPNARLSGGACRVTILRAQIEQTIFQFSGIKKVLFEPPELLQP